MHVFKGHMVCDCFGKVLGKSDDIKTLAEAKAKTWRPPSFPALFQDQMRLPSPPPSAGASVRQCCRLQGTPTRPVDSLVGRALQQQEESQPRSSCPEARRGGHLHIATLYVPLPSPKTCSAPLQPLVGPERGST